MVEIRGMEAADMEMERRKTEILAKHDRVKEYIKLEAVRDR